MKSSAKPFSYTTSALLLGVLAAVASGAGCSAKQSKETAEVQAVPLQQSIVKPAALTTTQPDSLPATKEVAPRPKPPAAKRLTYRSRDYGIAFDYPWQYGYVSARAMGRDSAEGESDSNADGEKLTLARVEIPKGFYPDTDFESASMTVSVNQNVDEQGCYASVGASTGSGEQTETINGVPFRWDESDEGGHGKSLKQRNYVSFANDTCYELELLVKTSNDGALAREVDPDQVFQRLDAMLKTVKVSVSEPKSAPAQPVVAETAASESDK
jgi:hypothetical protein